jgi:hypothetical protein
LPPFESAPKASPLSAEIRAPSTTFPTWPFTSTA